MNRFGGVFIAMEKEGEVKVQVVAREATLAFIGSPPRFQMAFDNGHLFLIEPAKNHAMMAFRTLSLQFPAPAELDARLSILPRFQERNTSELWGSPPDGSSALPWRYELARRFGRTAGSLILIAMSIFLSFFVRWRSRGPAIATAAALFLCYHLLDRFAEALLYRGAVGPVLAGLFSSFSIAAGFAVTTLFLVLRKKINKPLKAPGI